MPKKLDYTTLIGKAFGRLVVVGLGIAVKNKWHKRQSLSCLCECGVIKDIQYNNLFSGNTKSCGCYRVETSLEKIKHVTPLAIETNTLVLGSVERNAFFGHYKASAKKRNLEFNLEMEDFEYFTQKPCHYCGEFRKNKTPSGWAILNGLDRKDNSLGYVVDNILPCCSICNYAKRDMPYNDFIQWIAQLTHFQGRYSRED